MNNEQEALEILFGTSNALWRDETRHEALLLLKTLYTKVEALRGQLCKLIVAGPEPGLFERHVEQENIDNYIFEILSYLRASNLPLSNVGEQRLQQISTEHPRWTSHGHEGMSHWMEEGWVDKNMRGDTIKSLNAEQVTEYIKSFQPEWNFSLRDLSESIGARIAQEPEWGFRALSAIGNGIASLPQESMNPVLWGIRASLNNKSSKLDRETGLQLIDVLNGLVKRLPSPSAWSSLPSLVKDLVEALMLDVDSWDLIGSQLQVVFKNFDFDRSKSEKPIPWLQEAINHPYGDLTQLYLKLAQKHVSTLTTSGQPLVLEPRSAVFFAAMSEEYSVGSRFGYCLVAERLAWMEAVAPSYASIMRSWFNWAENEERALVVWSGYLWSRTLSRLLVENFESTYEETARRHKDFARQERNGLASHLAAVFWFHKEMTSKLSRIATLVDSEIRLGILHGWKNHLQTATPDAAAAFFKDVILPYWDSCSREQFFSVSVGSAERLAFWELLAHSHAAFPQASIRAKNLKPEKLESLHLSVRDLVSKPMFDFPDELTALLIAWAEINPHPQWEIEDWRDIWPKLQAKRPKDLVRLENELARRGLTL